ncbi:MAG: response regulator [Paracoccaceae bacterium]|nr:response regulator [Paracoccaceae bacterium]
MAFVQSRSPSKPAETGQLVVVDDAPFDHAAARRAAGKLGLGDATLGFFMAEDALEHLARRDRAPVDYLLVDLRMPRMGGLEFLAEAQRRFGQGFARAVFLTLTIAPDRALEAAMDHLGMIDGWVEKPLTTAVLERILSSSVAVART